jgi:hypothetical protein
MARNIQRTAAGLGAQVIAPVPDTGGGALGAARLARIVKDLQSRLVPGQGKQGRPMQAGCITRRCR